MIAVVDYGLGNLKSVAKALLAQGAEVKVTSAGSYLKDAKAIVLPGVGAFKQGIENLKRLGLLEVLIKEIEKGKPFLGICLGLQLLFTESEEHSLSNGMDVIKGRVVKFNKSGVKIPHMGWNQIVIKEPLTGSRGTKAGKESIFTDIPDNSYFYFVHSYYVVPQVKDIISAVTFYGEEFTSAVIKDNVIGLQFHPEKSGDLGLKILRNFLELIK
ncbi:MAG: imidazole glycerol phosphate synthase subunit HisH [Candidatus Omnitrophica bacterium]|nr:imidazole glycerol phosphate synthase subunit HisH [Candidatus Omnitrophota bacterium]